MGIITVRKGLLAVVAAVVSALVLASCGGGNGENAEGEWVDLGLPSGTLWYSVNLGAGAPEEYGDCYAWGETEEKESCTWETYRWCNGAHELLTKYCNSVTYAADSVTDQLEELEPADDVATVVLGEGASIPTRDDWEELKSCTRSKWTTVNGVKGRKFSAHGKSIFLPAGGCQLGGERQGAETRGDYWSSSLNPYDPGNAWYFYFDEEDKYVSYYYRYYGRSIRPVRHACQ